MPVKTYWEWIAAALTLLAAILVYFSKGASSGFPSGRANGAIVAAPGGSALCGGSPGTGRQSVKLGRVN